MERALDIAHLVEDLRGSGQKQCSHPDGDELGDAQPPQAVHFTTSQVRHQRYLSTCQSTRSLFSNTYASTAHPAHTRAQALAPDSKAMALAACSLRALPETPPAPISRFAHSRFRTSWTFPRLG